MDQIEKVKALFKDTVIFAIGSLGSKLILFLLVPLYTNYLTSDEYGIAELIITMSQLLIPLLSINIFSAVIRFGLAKRVKNEDVLINAIFVSVFSIGICYFIRPLLGLINSISPWKDYLLIYAYSNILTSIEFNYLKATNQNRLFAMISIIQTATLAIINIIMIAFLRKGVQGYLFANTFACTITAIIIFFSGGLYRDFRKGKLNPALLKEMIAYSAPLIINDISWWFIHASDKIMIENMLDSSKLGIYTLASKIPSLINVFIVIFSQSWGISSIREIEESKNAGKYYADMFDYYYVLAFAASYVLIILIKPFMSIYVGEKFISSWKYVPLLLVSASFSAISSFLGSIYAALKQSKKSTYTTVVAAIINVTLNYLFISLYGIWGALIGTICAYFAIANIRLIDIAHQIRFDINWIRYCVTFSIITVHATLVSFDYFPAIVSMLAGISFFILNREKIQSLFVHTKTIFFGRKIR